MLRIKKGMYIKYTGGMLSNNTPPRIGKIIDFSDKVLVELDNNQFTLRDHILKASHNIIDLISVGDFINGMRIIAKDSDNRLYIAEDLGQPYDREFYNGCFEHTIIDERFKIKSILTKEQYENNCYRVEE